MTNNKVYLYSCDLRHCCVKEEELLAILNAKDAQRYKELKSKRSRSQFAHGRWLIKQALQKLVNLPASHQYQIYNFNRWQVSELAESISISISHSGDCVVVAIALGDCVLGVDVEKHKIRNFDALVDGFCTPVEQSMVENSTDKSDTFYRLWTAKEAFLKASKLSLPEVCQQDLSECLTSDNSHYGKYQYIYSRMLENAYSLSLFSTCGLPIKFENVTYSL